MTVIVVLGASGLIGNAIAEDLLHRGYRLCAIARRFTPGQKAALGETAILSPVVSLDDTALAELLKNAEIVINCIGVLQDAPGVSADDVHRAFTARLANICVPGKLLIHLSVPGTAEDDRTPFSRSKRAAEAVIAAAAASFVILRPGFVIAPAAYGGSALIRALAMLPVHLPQREAHATFAPVAISDISETVARVVARWQAGEHDWRTSWDVMDAAPHSVGDVIEAFRRHLGGPVPRITLPGRLMMLGAWSGDAAAWLGWRPPIRSTALAEMRRGVSGDPRAWMTDTGITPRPLAVALPPATVQERWFARLYLLKALALVTLVLFWCASGLIALTVAFVPARAILLAHGFSMPIAHAITLASSLMDVAVGLGIAFRRSCRAGLIAGIAVSLFYMAGAAILTPEMWGEPLGALVKTFPAIILMLVCLATLEPR